MMLDAVEDRERAKLIAREKARARSRQIRREAETTSALSFSPRLSRRSLLRFTQATYPDYYPEKLHFLIAKALDQAVAGKRKRLMIIAPPRHGKSELCSVRLPTWWLGRNPDKPVIMTSSGATLAEDFSAQSKNIVASPEYKEIFPYIGLQSDSTAKEFWRIRNPENGRSYKGYVRAAGFGGNIMGRGMDLGIVDDPIASWAEAQSETVRERVHAWYKGTFRHRLHKGGVIVLIMCMVGDTPVLMADGAEKPIKDIRPGDRVATYKDGLLATSKVLNWANQGLDSVYEIRMKSGTRVKANERHPFLVNRSGKPEWIRLRNLKIGDRIIRAERSTENTEGSAVHSRAVTNQPNANAYACRTTTNPAGPMGFDRRPSILNREEPLESSIDTECRSKNTKECSRSKAGYAPFAANRLQLTSVLIGEISCASITTTPQGRFEGCCAMTATSQSGTERQKKSYSKPLDTFEITQDSIVEIVEAGHEDVFDIQVEDTENFIANGLVSHNTRWHEDDLAGRLLNEQAGKWTVLRFPAIAETQDERDMYAEKYGLPEGEPDLLDREPGEVLAPERMPLDEILDLKVELGSMVFSALYQGSPRPPEGNVFKDWWFPPEIFLEQDWIDQYVEFVGFVRYWDKAGTDDAGAFTVGVLMGVDTNGLYYVLDVQREQLSAFARNEMIRQTARLDYQRYGHKVSIWIEQEPGSGGKESAEISLRQLAGYSVQVDPVSDSKGVRLRPFAAQCEAQNVRIKKDRRWNNSYIAELLEWSEKAKYVDQVDASSGAFNHLTLDGPMAEDRAKKLARALMGRRRY